MTQRTQGIVGCVALAAAAGLGVAVGFFEPLLMAIGIPYHFLNYSLLAIALTVLAVVCGYSARATWPGKIALFGGVLVGVLVIGFVTMVFIAFSNYGR